MLRTLTVATVLLLAAPLVAQPQPRATPTRPVFSPYLNLLGGTGNPGLNYYGIVRPQMQLQQQFNQLQQQTNQQFAALGQSADAQLDPLMSGAYLPPTGGTVSVFGSTAGYFGRIPTGNMVSGTSRFGSGGGGGLGGLSGMGGAGGFQRPAYAGSGQGKAAAGGGRR